MNKKLYLILLTFILVWGNNISAQVTIGSLTPPDESAVLQVISPDNNKGVLIPKMSREQRDKIVNPAGGLMIFNTDENCYNYYNGANREWTSLCGGTANAKGVVQCLSATLNGTLIQGTPANTGNFLTVPVTVEKAGLYYAITAEPKPANGYYFTASGSFPAPGDYSVNLFANGVPTRASDGDDIVLTFNGEQANCTGLKVPVNVAAPDYTITNVAVVPARFPVNSPLSAANNYLNVTLSVKNPGQWVLVSNTVNGYQFSAQGNISQASGYNPAGSFPQTVTVTVPVTGGQAIDIGTGSDQFTLSNSGSITPSFYSFYVPLAAVGFNIVCDKSFAVGNFEQNVPLTNQYISLDINVETTGSTTIYASGAGIRFISEPLVFDTKGPKTIILKPDPAITSGPVIGGNQLLSITSEKGGVLNACNIPIYIQPAIAIVGSMSFAFTNPNSGNYIIDADGDKPAYVTISVVASAAGEYNFATDEINGVTYKASGTLTAQAAPQEIVLSPEGTPTDKVGTVTYTLTANGKTVTFDINFVYRAMKILVVGINPGYDLSNVKKHIDTSYPEGAANFGAKGKVPTAGITLTTYYEATGRQDPNRAGDLGNLIKTNNYDIVLTGFSNNIWNTADIEAMVNYVNKNGVLFAVTEGYSNAIADNNTIRNVMEQLFGISTISNGNSGNLWYSANIGTQSIYQIKTNANDPIINGAFGNISGSYLGDDALYTSRLLVGDLPPAAIALASPLQGTTPQTNVTPEKSYFSVRHSTLGFVWAGDGGFWGAYADRPSTQGDTGSPVNSSSPLKSQGWNVYAPGSGLTSGTVRPVENGKFLMNFLGYAIDYAGTHKRGKVE